MGGRVPGPETLYMADSSPLKKIRGAVFLRVKRDFMKSQCSIVATDFCIRLGEDKVEHSRTSTVFGFVCDGLAVCDAISHIDCNKEHVAIASVGVVG
jgi:cyclophilin family peptidyl-prolyl cis-trans isomerase